MKRILVVCMGNICRSPTGEAVLRAKAKELGVDVDIDSAGTIGYHTGNTPDSRAMAAGKQRGYSFKGMRARQVSVQDFEDFDLVLAADKANLADLLDICPVEHRHKVSLFLSHSNSSYDEIPDPYYGGDDGFELVLDLIEEASVAVLQKL
ncbi:TPA: low molecular weight phosphotyrosine protein phosphatase [Vibrio parahaemolyticus]|uniref:protein-tyrosine-phosphatase n=1 Tax=Vibrio parahaemolyticus TaxID=670 RepID=A0AAW8Q1U2_VIBPH|nr:MULTISPECIES: low molecular weight protein-tyrosine-phosphatase [Vibrio]EGR1751046.1 low molecular weight phosphotyrosine protein phosphatase [Vibrio parahaemolyticus]EHK0840677.1 low molecular weight phosphotyrosine protein phosphatase [Vibrio parahaemolyticus]EII3139857.1 low molecular weight phosphotyrosine protein phosphatase [Vibrio parahaemolyticus]EJB8407505.1 low molecular weight phosphotyrosine protein phosphatase [Vibrio parahaemolyticus]EJB8531040.1 low molecular weight phosphoty